MGLKVMKLFVVMFLSLNLAVSFAKGRDHHRHKDDCKKSEFKSWDQLKNSKSIEYLEDESSIVIETNCKIKLHKNFSFSTQKDLSIKAKEMQIKKDSSLTAGRLLIETEKEFKLEKRSTLCADVFILEAKKKKLKGDICASAVLLGSSFDAPSALAVLEVSLDQDKAPVQAVFDWSKSFGLFDSATIDFGDDTSQVLSQATVTKIYEQAGEYSAQLSLQTKDGPVLSHAVEVLVNEANPIIDFGVYYIIRRAGDPMHVSVAPNYTQLVEAPEQIKEFRFNFGDGTTLSVPYAESPTGYVGHVYAQQGTYQVTIEAETISGFIKTATRQIDFINESNPVPLYSLSAFNGQAPLTVTFNGEAYDDSGDPITYNWYFSDTGEDFFGTEFNQVTHTFTQEGIHYVYYEARDEKRGRRITYIPIYVGNYPDYYRLPPVAIAESSARFGEAPLTVEFSAVRSFDPNEENNGLRYSWNFGDYQSGEQNYATTANAVHTFTRPGSYFVNLEVISDVGLTRSEFLLVSVDGAEVNDIDFEVTPTANLFEYNFSAYGYFEETDYIQESPRWSFGDGSYLVNEPNVTHQYQSAGTYDVELKLRRPDGAYDSYTRRLTVAENQQTSYAQIEKQSEWFNLGQPVQMRAEFTEGVSSDKTIYRWSTGDGTIIKGQGDAFKTIVHSYNQPGDKNIRLTITADNGLTSTSYSSIQENRYAPEIDGLPIYFTENPAPVTVAFQPYETSRDLDGNFSHYIYEFGDGSPNIQTTDGYQEHRYETGGTYTVAVSVFDTLGLSSRFERELVIKENQPPVLTDFNLYIPEGPAPTTIVVEAWPFASDAEGGIYQYEFNWGDGQLEYSDSGYREHFYSIGGDYSISIRVQDTTGLWSSSVTKNISLSSNIAPTAVITQTDGSFYAPSSLKFTGSQSTDSDGTIVAYNWMLSDGRYFEGQDIEFTIDQVGQYLLQLQVVDSNGGIATSEQIFVVKENEPPVALISYSTLEVTEYQVFELDASGSSDPNEGQRLTYEWNVSNGKKFTGEKIYPFFNEAGTYDVTLKVSDDSGLYAEQTLSVLVTAFLGNKPNVELEILTTPQPDGSFRGEISFDGSRSFARGTNIDKYEWFFSDGYYGEGNFFLRRSFDATGNYFVELKITTSLGNVASREINFNVNSIVEPNLISSDYEIIVEGIYEDQFNPLLVTTRWKIDQANFQAEIDPVLMLNGEIINNDNVIRISPSEYSASLGLRDGINNIQFFTYDENENKAFKELEVYAGSSSLELELMDTRGMVLSEKTISLSLPVEGAPTVQLTTNQDGRIVFGNLPSSDRLIRVNGQNIFVSEIIEKNLTYKRIYSNFIDESILTDANLNFSDGLNGWYLDASSFDLSESVNILTANATEGGNVILSRTIKVLERGFYSFPGKVKFLGSKGNVISSTLNLTTGEFSEFSKFIDYISNEEFDATTTVFAEVGDVVTFKRELSVSQAGVTSILSPISNAYASGTISTETEGVQRSSIFVSSLELLEVTTEVNNESVLSDINLLSLVDFDKLKNERLDAPVNELFADFFIVLGEPVYNPKITDFTIRINGSTQTIITKLSTFDLDVETTETTTTIKPIEFVNKRLSTYFSLDKIPSNIRESINNVEFQLTVIFENDEGLQQTPVNIVKNFNKNELLFAHDYTYDHLHYDGNDTPEDSYNLLGAQALDKGDFWTKLSTNKILADFFGNINNFEVGDLSNMNGGEFSPHDIRFSHPKGNAIDAKTSSYGSGVKLSEHTLDDIESIYNADINNSVIFNVLAFYGDDFKQRAENRCIKGLSSKKLIFNDSNHKNHLHINITRPDLPSKFMNLSTFPEFTLNSADHPDHPGYRYIEFANVSSVSGVDFNLDRASFRLVDLKDNRTLFNSSNFEISRYEDEFVDIIAIRNPNNTKTNGIVYKLKLDSFVASSFEVEAPQYKIVASAISDSAERCNNIEVELFDIEPDCNNNGVADDPGIRTIGGGVVALGIETKNHHIVSGDARLCGNSFVSEEAQIILDGNVILEDVNIAENCESIYIDGSARINNTAFCFEQIPGKGKSGDVVVSGDNITIQDASISGDVFVTTNSRVSDNSSILGRSTIVDQSIILGSRVEGAVGLFANSFVEGSNIFGNYSDVPASTFDTYLNISGASVNGSILQGIGIVNGFVGSGSFFNGIGSAVSPSGLLLVMHVYPTASLYNGASVSGNAFIEGTVRDGGITNNGSSRTIRSGVVSSVGAGGQALCYALVLRGELRYPLCNQVYDSARAPSTQDIFDWTDGVPWPSNQ